MYDLFRRKIHKKQKNLDCVYNFSNKNTQSGLTLNIKTTEFSFTHFNRNF